MQKLNIEPIRPHPDPNAPPSQRDKREWNREPLLSLFPRIPAAALERILDICIEKRFTYNLSESRLWNSRRYTCIVVAHVRHFYTDYDALLRHGDVERYAARRRSADKAWKILRDWCPWDDSNEVLEKCFQATLLPPEEREPGWDPMEIDDESDYAPREQEMVNCREDEEGYLEDKMDLD